MFALCIALFALGHLVRDGFPNTGETQIARGVGAFFCMAGASAVLSPLQAVTVGLAIGIGFFTDQKHAEGQQARGWQDAWYLALSGLTSVAPLALVLSVALFQACMVGPFLGLSVAINLKALALIVAAGFAKVPVYFVAWRIFSKAENGVRVLRFGAWLQPTRMAAIVFGATIGASVGILG